MNAWYASVLDGTDEFATLTQPGFSEEKSQSAYRVVNSVWKNEDLPGEFREAYVREVAEKFRADASSAPAAQLANAVNAWVNEQTNGLIPKLLNNASDSSAVLVNALYLKTGWREPFRAAGEADFTSADGSIGQKEYMEITGKYAEVKSVSYNADTKKLKFNARMTIPDDAVMTQLGIIATSNAAIKYNLTLDTKPEAGVTFVKATTTGLDGIKGTNYTWTKTAVGKDDVWYAVPYVCYELNGETVTKYGALVEATAEGVTPVELATAEYVRAEYTNEKLKFHTLVSITDGRTMNAIGVCATSNAETAGNLTLDTPEVTGVTYIKKVDTGLEGITKTGYHWTKSAVKEGTTWFVKPYVTYTDADGVQQTIYGDLEPVKAESEKS
jgi:hypothetical protein